MGLPLPELGPLKDPKRFGFRFHVIVKAKIESCDEKTDETILDASEIKQDVFRILALKDTASQTWVYSVKTSRYPAGKLVEEEEYKTLLKDWDNATKDSPLFTLDKDVKKEILIYKNKEKRWPDPRPGKEGKTYDTP